MISVSIFKAQLKYEKPPSGGLVRGRLGDAWVFFPPGWDPLWGGQTLTLAWPTRVLGPNVLRLRESWISY